MAYITLNKAHTHHNTTINGQPTSQYSRYETGVITGTKRHLPAILADSTGSNGYGFDSAVGSDDDSWHVLNAFDDSGSYVDTIAVGGAMDDEHALVVAQTQLDSLGASSVALIGVGLTQFDSLNQSPAGTFSIDALNKLMDNPSQDKNYLPVVTASELAYETDRVTFDSVEWADNSDQLLSHDGRDSTLMLDMTRADTRNDLVTEFELADVLDLLGAEPEQSFDALMDTKNRLDLLKNRLFKALARAGDDKLSVTNVIETKPFKRQGVTNIAFVFDLSDGQKLSIWFHNPDSTPSKLMPSDIMISWKWMLNKRDVTAALSPKQGDNVQLPTLANRIMRVAAKNSMRFKRTQARAIQLEQDLLDAQNLVETKTATIEQLDKDIESLSTQIDAAMKAPEPEPIIEPTVEPVIEPVAEPSTTDSDIADADIMPANLNQMQELKTLRGLAPKSGEAIKSDDPDAIEKLEAKLAYLQAFASVMRQANKHVRKGDDAALSKMGFNDKEIATLKEPDYAGRTGFADYQMTNNNGEMGRIKKRLKGLYRARELELAESDESEAASQPNEPMKAGEIDAVANDLNNNFSTGNDFWDKSVSNIQALSDEDFNRLSESLENANYHSENVVFRAKRSGSRELTLKAEAILMVHQEVGSLSIANRSRRDELSMKIDNILYPDPQDDTNQAVEPANYPPVEYDAGMDDYIAFKDASKKDKWYARHDNRNGEWTVRVDNEYTRGFGDDEIVKVGNAELLIQKFPAFEGLIELINANAEAKQRATGDNKYNLNTSDLKGFNEGVSNYDSSLVEGYLDDIAKKQAELDSKNIDYLSKADFQARINSGDETGHDVDHYQNKIDEFAKQVEALRDQKIKPSKVVGTGYKDPRKSAFEWLSRMMQENLFALNGDPVGFNSSMNTRSYLIHLKQQLKDSQISEPLKSAPTTESVQAEANERHKADVLLQAQQLGWEVLDTHVAEKSFKIPKYATENSEYEGLYNKTSLDNVIVMVANDTTGQPFVSAWAAGKYGSYKRLGEYDIEAATGLSAYILKRFEAMNLVQPIGGNVDDLFNTRMDGSVIDSDPTNPNNKKITKGKSNKAKTPKGTKIESEFALVDAKFLIASHTANGSKNPKYPQELQPRDRARESSIAWVQKTSKALDPESLGRTGRVDTGAPIVGDDLVVESGNGRTIAIKMAYANGDAGEYREWLTENADMFGMTAKQVESYKQPILVRMRTTDVNRSDFAVEANQDDKLSFTASERAKADAKRVNAGMLELFSPNESGDILAASNRDFVKSFLASLGATEAAQYTDSNGNPTQALVARIKGALFSKAYDDDRLLEMMADQTKPELQNTLNALTMAAPNFVAAQAVNRSDAQDLAEKVVDSVEKSLSDEVKNAIVDATNMIMNAKISGQDVKEYVLQQGLFEQVDDATAELAVFLAANARSAKKMTDYFNAMASYIEQDSVSRQNLDMFGEPEPLSLADVIAHANSKVNENTDTIGSLDMFDEPVVEPVVEPNLSTESVRDVVNKELDQLSGKSDYLIDKYLSRYDFESDIWNAETDFIKALPADSFDKINNALNDAGMKDEADFIKAKRVGNQKLKQEAMDRIIKKESQLAQDDFNAVNLAAKVDGIINEINSVDFDAENFDVDALTAISDEAEGNDELTAKLEAASELYQKKLIAIAMQAMASMVGQ